MDKAKYFLFVFVLLTSCIQSYIVPNKIKKKLTICYDAKPTNLESKINTKGYYQSTDIWWNTSSYGKTYNPRWDTSKFNILFFNDGICAYGFHSWKYTEEKYLATISKIPDAEISSLYKGLYQVIGDTIKIQVINDCRGAAPTWMGAEILYKIIDRNTIKHLGEKQLHNNNGYNESEVTDNNTRLAHFMPADSLPTSNIWLKKKKWFLCQN